MLRVWSQSPLCFPNCIMYQLMSLGNYVSLGTVSWSTHFKIYQRFHDENPACHSCPQSPPQRLPSGFTFSLYTSNYTVLVWVSSKADCKVSIWVQVVYSGDYPGSTVKGWGRERREGMCVRVNEPITTVGNRGSVLVSQLSSPRGKWLGVFIHNAYPLLVEGHFKVLTV